MGDIRSATGGKFLLKLDKAGSCGILKSCTPGMYKANVVEIADATGHFTKKTIDAPTLGAFECEIGIQSAGKPLQNWFNDAVNLKTSRSGGSLLRADFDNKIKSEITFTEALPTTITVPACDGSSKNNGLVKFSFQPEGCKTQMASGELDKGEVAAAQKQWMEQNFRFSIDGMAEGCKRVSKVDALTFKMETTWDLVGHRRQFDLVPSKMTFSNLKVTFSEVDAADWLKWYDDFIIAGKTAEDVGEKTASLEYLSPDLGKSLLTVNLHNCGLFSLSMAKDEKEGGKAVRSMVAEMYTEGWNFNWGG
ncbi:MAG TPA: hypothetical protein VKE22_09815 [Haliangiales bacterium]|nr:hypothetical protein [Haliangiales bacterium]